MALFIPPRPILVETDSMVPIPSSTTLVARRVSDRLNFHLHACKRYFEALPYPIKITRSSEVPDAKEYVVVADPRDSLNGLWLRLAAALPKHIDQCYTYPYDLIPPGATWAHCWTPKIAVFSQLLDGVITVKVLCK